MLKGEKQASRKRVAYSFIFSETETLWGYS